MIKRVEIESITKNQSEGNLEMKKLRNSIWNHRGKLHNYNKTDGRRNPSHRKHNGRNIDMLVKEKEKD